MRWINMLPLEVLGHIFILTEGMTRGQRALGNPYPGTQDSIAVGQPPAPQDLLTNRCTSIGGLWLLAGYCNKHTTGKYTHKVYLSYSAVGHNSSGRTYTYRARRPTYWLDSTSHAREIAHSISTWR